MTGADYSKGYLNLKTNRENHFISKVRVSEKAQEASYLAAELIAWKRK
jgi:hypothetical protein